MARTPSGQAIIAATLKMPKDKRGKFIIHLTDGESNIGASVQLALNFCRKEKIDIVTLGCGYRDPQLLRNRYSSSLQLLNYFEQLPTALEILLRKKLLEPTFY
jgi:hypothetical protein